MSGSEAEKHGQTTPEASTAERDINVDGAERSKEYASGFKLVIIVASLCLSLFLCGLVSRRRRHLLPGTG